MTIHYKLPSPRIPTGPRPTVPLEGQPLTPRQRQMALLVGQAKLNKEIAYELGVTPNYIKAAMVAIAKKLGARNRVDIALRIRGVI